MRTRSAIALAAAAVIALVAGYLLSSNARVDATTTLRQAYARARSVDYQGTVTTTVFYCGREFATRSAVRHKGSGERIEYLSGPVSGAVVVASGGQTRTYRPDTKQVLVSRASGQRTRHENLDLLLKNYSADLIGCERVADRLANVIDLKPTHNGNPSKRLWIDRETGVALKREDRSASGQLRSRVQFSTIEYTPQSHSAIFKDPSNGSSRWVEREGDRESPLADVEKAVGIDVALPRYLPPGYVLDSARVYACECGCGHKAAHLRYTDGLNSISVFQTPRNISCGSKACRIHCPADGRCEVRDARQARVATASSGERSIVVVADLPEEVIARVAKSVRE